MLQVVNAELSVIAVELQSSVPYTSWFTYMVKTIYI